MLHILWEEKKNNVFLVETSKMSTTRAILPDIPILVGTFDLHQDIKTCPETHEEKHGTHHTEVVTSRGCIWSQDCENVRL